MKKTVLTFALLFGSFGLFAQEETATDKAPKEGWTRAGNISFLFNQSAFNFEWKGASGGVNNIAGNLGLNYDFNYIKGDWTWDNKIIASYGLTKLDSSEEVVKTDDRLEFNSLAGKKAGGDWFYSLFFNFKTQMDSGFAQSEQTATLADGSTINIPVQGVRNSHFFSPAYFQFGPGMLWKKSDNLKVNIAPATSKLIIVHDEFTEFTSAFGVEQGDTSRYELGASISAYYKFNLMKNISMENILNLYSNYLEDPQNVDIDYTMNLVMAVNKYISANLTFQAIYDDNTIGAFRIKEVFGLGVNYGF